MSVISKQSFWPFFEKCPGVLAFLKKQERMVHNPWPVGQYVKVHDKSPDLYQDTNWSYDQKILTSEAEVEIEAEVEVNTEARYS